MNPRQEILKIAVPVSTEFVVMLTINFVNQIIVGGLGTIAIAGVGFANSLTFIPLVVLGASVSRPVFKFTPGSGMKKLAKISLRVF